MVFFMVSTNDRNRNAMKTLRFFFSLTIEWE